MDPQRDAVSLIKNYLNTPETILIIGPRQSGKTTVMHQLESFLKSKDHNCYFLNLEDPDYLKLLNESPKNLFQIFPINPKNQSYLFIDEVQYLNNPSNFLKYYFDEYKEKIKIIASGSSAFYLDKKFKDSLAGRKKIFTLLTLTFKEFLKFKNEADLSQKDLKNLTISEIDKIKPLYMEYITYGGYPRVILAKTPEEKIEDLRDLAYSYVKKDIYESGVRQDEYFYNLLKILASQTGSLVNSLELSKTLGLSKTAIDNYLYIMQKSFHINLIKPFFKNIRKELIKMPKVFFTDLGLRNFFKNDFRPIIDRDDKGQLLENAAFRSLADKYPSEDIKFWRTITQKEVDFVLENQKLAFEVKINPNNMKQKEYSLFKDSYPEIKLDFISLNQSSKSIPPWQI